MILYWIILICTLIFVLMYALTYKQLIFKNTKFYYFTKSNTTISILKKLRFSIIALLTIIISIFFLTELLPNKYFTNSNANSLTSISENNIFENLCNYLYNIIPFPKKVCSTTHLENNTIICSSYEYTLINLGISSSYMQNIPVSSIIKEKCLISFYIGIIAYALQCMIGYPLGIYLAKKENKLIDKFYNTFHILIRIIPTIIYFYLFAVLFMVILKMPILFDIYNPITYVAPLTALTLCSSLSIAFFVRKYILIEMNKDYVKFAISKGLSENKILYTHVLRNAIIPFIRTIPSSILMCFSGFYLLESTFNIPGIGLALIYSIQLKDIALIRGLIIFFAFLSIIAHLIGDLLTIIFNKKDYINKEVLQVERK